MKTTLFASIIAAGAALSSGAEVVFRECPKCEFRIKIADDCKTAYVNLSKLDGISKVGMKGQGMKRE